MGRKILRTDLWRRVKFLVYDALPNSSHLHCWNLVNTLLQGNPWAHLELLSKVLQHRWLNQVRKAIGESIGSAITGCQRWKPTKQTVSSIRAAGKKRRTPKATSGLLNTTYSWLRQITELSPACHRGHPETRHYCGIGDENIIMLEFTVPWHITEDVSLLSIGRCFITAGLKQNFHNFCCDHRQICLFSCIIHIYTSLINKVNALMSNYSSKD